MTLTRRCLSAVLLLAAAGCQRSAPDNFERGLAYYHQDKFAKAAAHFEQAVTTGTPTAQAWNFLGVCRLHTGHTHDAISAFERALQLDPTHSAARYNLAVAHLEADHPETAIPHLRQLTQLGSPIPSVYYQLGRAHFRTGNWLAAKAAFDKLSDADAHPDIQNTLGIIETKLGNFKTAATRFQRALQLDPQLAAAHLNLATLEHHYRGQKQAAIEHYQHYLELLPKNQNRDDIRLTLNQLIQETSPPIKPTEPPPPPAPAPPSPTPQPQTVAGTTEKTAESKTTHTPLPATATPTPPATPVPPTPPPPPKRRPPIAATLRPGNRTLAKTFFNDGIAQHQQAKYTAAITAYQKAVQADPTFAQAYYNMAIAYRETRQPEKALANYELALLADPNFADARFNYALLLQQEGYIADAIAQYEKILETNPNETTVRLTLASLYARDPATKSQARQHYQAYLRLAPNAPASRDIRRWLEQNP